MAFLQTSAPYKRGGSIPPVYIVFRAACFSLQLSFADLDGANINFVHSSAMWLMCSLKISLLSSIMSRYFILCTWIKGLLFRYISISFQSFLFLLVISITFYLCSLNLIFLLTAHAKILINSTLSMFSASCMDSAFIIITKASANTTPFVWLVYLNVRREIKHHNQRIVNIITCTSLVTSITRRAKLISKSCPPELTKVNCGTPRHNKRARQHKNQSKDRKHLPALVYCTYNDHFDFSICLYPFICFTIFTLLPIRALLRNA